MEEQIEEMREEVARGIWALSGKMNWMNIWLFLIFVVQLLTWFHIFIH